MKAARATKPVVGRRAPHGVRRGRSGAVQSVELLLCLPVLLGLLFGIGEFSLLWAANHQLKAASYAACREASLPAVNDAVRLAAAQAAAERVLANKQYIEAYKIEVAAGGYTGAPVTVELRLPMKAAAPDLLAGLGISIEQKELTARTVMRQE